MTTARGRHCAVVAALLFATARAQDDTAATTLHDAWLTEVLDLDVPGAVAGYRQVAADTRPVHAQRWIAAARLAELRRLQVAAVDAPDVDQAPAPLRPLFAAAASELHVAELEQRLQGDPVDVLQRLASDPTRLPSLRPIVPGSINWLMARSGPSLRDRWRQRATAFVERSREEVDEAPGDRAHANAILRAELQGQTAQADALRALYFADWRAPGVDGDAATRLAAVQARLASLRAGGDRSSSQQRLLAQLAEALEQRAATPAAALAFVQRLPFYAERLLGEAEPTGR